MLPLPVQSARESWKKRLGPPGMRSAIWRSKLHRRAYWDLEVQRRVRGKRARVVAILDALTGGRVTMKWR
eukprot:11235365-Ditylum_brightwellii.AAC.1